MVPLMAQCVAWPIRVKLCYTWNEGDGLHELPAADTHTSSVDVDL